MMATREFISNTISIEVVSSIRSPSVKRNPCETGLFYGIVWACRFLYDEPSMYIWQLTYTNNTRMKFNLSNRIRQSWEVMTLKV